MKILARATATIVVILALVAVLGWSGGRGGDGDPDRVAARRIVALTNAARQQDAQAPLSINPRLTAAAEAYAREMARRERFDHIDPDGATVEQRAEAFGYAGWTFLAENLAVDSGTREAAGVVASWLRSPGHRRNILSADLEEVGVGCYTISGDPARLWCAQEFGTRGR
jgi:uncharacterized protein YkwD